MGGAGADARDVADVVDRIALDGQLAARPTGSHTAVARVGDDNGRSRGR
jgi:hypothetical protein